MADSVAPNPGANNLAQQRALLLDLARYLTRVLESPRTITDPHIAASSLLLTGLVEHQVLTETSRMLAERKLVTDG